MANEKSIKVFVQRIRYCAYILSGRGFPSADVHYLDLVPRVLVDFYRDVCESILLSERKHKITRGKHINHTINKMYNSIIDGHDVRGWWLI